MKKLIVIAAAFAVIFCGCGPDRLAGSGEGGLDTPPLAGTSETARSEAQPESVPQPRILPAPEESESSPPEPQPSPAESEPRTPPIAQPRPESQPESEAPPESQPEPEYEAQPEPQAERYGGTALGGEDPYASDNADEIAPEPLIQDGESGIDAAVFEEELFRLINAEREAVGEPALGMEDLLRWAARLRAPEVLDNLSHTRPDGSPYYSAFEDAGFDYAGKWHGENVSRMQFSRGMYTTREAAGAMFSQLAASTGHLNNMISENYDQSGIGVAIRADGDMITIASAQLFAGF